MRGDNVPPIGMTALIGGTPSCVGQRIVVGRTASESYETPPHVWGQQESVGVCVYIRGKKRLNA
jgi:hypothetical protein